MGGSAWTLYQAQPAARGGVIGLLRRWYWRARERSLLATLDDRMMADIGITRVERARECDKPFWRA
jgi:uncharacterized protein YjiS (DUF1127 family)